MSTKVIWRVGIALAVCLAVVVLASQMTTTTKAAGDFKGVICHATGSASNPYSGVVVGIGPNVDSPIFSNNGHLDANGSAFDGHEDDIYIGSAPPNTKQDCDKLPPPGK